MLSRCVATDTHTFATTYWGRAPLLSSADALPRDFSDLLSPDAVDELIAERGVRSPFIRLAKEGDLLAKDCYLGDPLWTQGGPSIRYGRVGSLQS